MPTFEDLKATFAEALPGEPFYWRAADGHCAGTEFSWLPVAQRWVWYDRDSIEIGSSEELYLYLYMYSTDDQMEGVSWKAIELDDLGRPSLYVHSLPPGELDLTDAVGLECYRVASPSEGLAAEEIPEPEEA